MSTLLIRRARIIDPEAKTEKTGDIFVRDGRIESLYKTPSVADMVIEADGLYASPGLVDMHVHFREPGNEEAETISSGSAAAVAGGFTTVCMMPNTEPPIDSEAAAEFVVLQSQRAGMANVLPVGAVTEGLQGKRLSEMGGLVRGGAVAFSDDGNPVRSAEILRRALLYTKMFDKVLIDHAEDPDLARRGVMHGGVVSTVLGMPGIPAAAEEIAVARDIKIAQITGGRLHIAHVSTAGAVALIRAAKEQGIRVTAEVTPHHLTLTDEEVASFDPNLKMKPPLRTKEDVEALIQALADGTIDAIATDHAPHTREAKELDFLTAPFGVIGLETALGVLLTRIVEPGHLGLVDLLRRMTLVPAEILGLPSKGRMRPGADADIVLFDTTTKWTVDPEKFRSKSRNTPFAGWELHGKVFYTIVSGRVVYEAG